MLGCKRRKRGFGVVDVYYILVYNFPMSGIFCSSNEVLNNCLQSIFVILCPLLSRPIRVRNVACKQTKTTKKIFSLTGQECESLLKGSCPPGR